MKPKRQGFCVKGLKQVQDAVCQHHHSMAQSHNLCDSLLGMGQVPGSSLTLTLKL